MVFGKGDMDIKRVFAVCFSPCGSVRRVAEEMASAASKRLSRPQLLMDITGPASRETPLRFQQGELVFFGMPVYAGRVPNKIMPFVRDSVKGEGAVAVPFVCYGNRNFDEALAELGLLLEAGGFVVAGGAAIAAEHSFSSKLAPGRPDERDIADIRTFAESCADKVLSASAAEFVESPKFPGSGTLEEMKYYRPLREDGEPADFLKALPCCDISKCIFCGACREACPMGVISLEEGWRASGICIKCQACVKACPQRAIYFDDTDFLSHVIMLEENFISESSSEFFL